MNNVQLNHFAVYLKLTHRKSNIFQYKKIEKRKNGKKNASLHFKKFINIDMLGNFPLKTNQQNLLIRKG